MTRFLPMNNHAPAKQLFPRKKSRIQEREAADTTFLSELKIQKRKKRRNFVSYLLYLSFFIISFESKLHLVQGTILQLCNLWIGTVLARQLCAQESMQSVRCFHLLCRSMTGVCLYPFFCSEQTCFSIVSWSSGTRRQP